MKYLNLLCRIFGGRLGYRSTLISRYTATRPRSSSLLLLRGSGSGLLSKCYCGDGNLIGSSSRTCYRYFSSHPPASPPSDDDDSSNKKDGSNSPPTPPPENSGFNMLGRKRMTRARFGSDDTSSMFAVEVPDYLPVVPVLAVRKHPLFPRFVKVVEIVDPEMRELIIRKIHLKQPYIGVFLRKDDSELSEVISGPDDVHDVGTFCFIHEIEEIATGDVMRMVVGSVRRIKYLGLAEEEKKGDEPVGNGGIVQTKSTKKCLLWNTCNVQSDEYEMSDEIKALSAEIIQSAREIMSHNPMYRDLFSISAIRSETFADDPARLADLGAVLSTAASSIELQDVMNEVDVKKRLLLSLSLLKKEIALLNLQQKISNEVEAKIKSQNRKHLLMEQLKIIKQELGIEKDDKALVAEKFKKYVENAGKLPEHVRQVIDDEINRLEHLDVQSAEFNVTRTYLDWLTCLPWTNSTDERLDLKEAKKVLDEDHYGMIDVKKRILEFIAVSKLRNKTQGKIMCFVGPPGVGKTSIAKSIARSLGREYFRFSVGGLVDVAEIKGHRRTYVGAMPGKIIQCLKKVKTDNPLVLIDEIDKIGRAGHTMGDPSSALLEMLDPEQNTNFLDHYLDVTIDLSKVLFVCTANVMDTVPDALRDRMEVISLSAEEKLAIAKQYLIPKAGEETGVSPDVIQLDDIAINLINRQYCRESGVRNLQKQIEKIYRKVAFEIVEKRESENNDDSKKYFITPDNLNHYIGKPIFTHDRMYDTTPIGVVAGLAWTAMGGSVLYVEVASIPSGTGSDGKSLASSSNPSAIITGNMGDVMKESVQIASTFAKNYIKQNHQHSVASNNVLTEAQIHVHVPEGASPKDGPSAGITLVTAMMSLALGIPVRSNVAMTGEISLKGNVLPVGGIKEKIIAAKRASINEIIMPADNRKDFDELPDFIKQNVKVHYVKTYADVFQLVF